jgi:hypothetical protein
MPLRPDSLHCASRWRAIIPSGDEEEIAVRGKELFRFVALLATCAFLERPTLIPSLIAPSYADGEYCFERASSDVGATPKVAYICEFDRGRTFPD